MKPRSWTIKKKFIKLYIFRLMEIKFIREYAARMAVVFATRADNAKKRGEEKNYIQELEIRKDLWEKVSHLPTDSDKWEIVKEYTNLMSTPKATKTQLRDQYEILRQTIEKTELTNSKVFRL
jgi:outer membrane receptor for monomeric catechols